MAVICLTARRQFADYAAQILHIGWFAQHALHMQWKMIRVSNAIARAGDQHNGGNGRRGLDRRGALPAASVRHSQIQQNDGERFPPERVVASLDNSLRVMGTERIDVFNLHGVELDDYDYALNTLAPTLEAEKRKGKIRHIGVTENPIADYTNEMLKSALRDPVWDVFMVGFHMMHQVARDNVFSQTQAKSIGTLLMFAVRSIFADPLRIAREVKELAAKGLVDPSLGATDDPLGFLIHDGGASDLIDAAYRYARHEPGVDVVLFGTGDAAHLRSNVASLLKPQLPDADRAKLAALFGHLTGIGLDGHQRPAQA